MSGKICLVLLLFIFTTLAAAPVFAGDSEYYPTRELNSLMTFPEWYVVFSAQEYAEYLKRDGKPSRYNYQRSIRTYWNSYYFVTREAVARGYPFSFANHLMLGVVGLSYTGEYQAKHNYEKSIGVFSELLSFGYRSQEDIYAQQVAEEYGQFITVTPWFDFPFFQKLTGLWTQTSFFGPDLIRKWERKFALTLEYEIKAIYGLIMHYATNSTYAPSKPYLEVETTIITPELFQKYPDLKLIRQTEPGKQVISFPRFKRFTEITPDLLRHNIRLISIDNNKIIQLTAIIDKNKDFSSGQSDVLFETFVSSDPGKKRISIISPVESLHEVISELDRQDAELEHLFDY